MEVINEVENKLIGRKQVIAKTTSDGSTVSRADVKKELAKKFKVDEEQIIINSIDSTFGSLDVNIDCDIYDKKGIAEKIEAKHILARNAAPEVEVEESAEEAPAPAEPAAEEAPAQEASEESEDSKQESEDVQAEGEAPKEE